jgi:hypothetical protein
LHAGIERHPSNTVQAPWEPSISVHLWPSWRLPFHRLQERGLPGLSIVLQRRTYTGRTRFERQPLGVTVNPGSFSGKLLVQVGLSSFGGGFLWWVKRFLPGAVGLGQGWFVGRSCWWVSDSGEGFGRWIMKCCGGLWRWVRDCWQGLTCGSGVGLASGVG